MGIEIKQKSGFEVLLINDIEVDTDDGEIYYVPKSLLNGIRFDEMPNDITFEICDQVLDNTIYHNDFVPYSIRKADNSKAFVLFNSGGTRKYWDGEVGFKLYMETMRDIIIEREREIGDIHFESFDDDGAHIFLKFSAEIEAETFDTVIDFADQVNREIEGTLEITLGSSFEKINDEDDEKEFTLKILVPLIRKLGFSNVRYNHGEKEFGKDIIFSRRTEFDEFEYWGVQVKTGDISGGANSQVDMIISQIDDAFKMPFYDVYTRQKKRLSKVIIAISGKFTENAIEKICEKIESHAIRNNIVFMDGEKIKTLIERFRR